MRLGVKLFVLAAGVLVVLCPSLLALGRGGGEDKGAGHGNAAGIAGEHGAGASAFHSVAGDWVPGRPGEPLAHLRTASPAP